MKYIVIKNFVICRTMDAFIMLVMSIKEKKTKARIDELATDKNRIGTPLIKKEE